MTGLSRSIVSLLALAIGLEGGTRLDELIRLGTPLGSTASSVNDIITIDANGARGLPGGHYRQFAFNSVGLRGPELTGRPRILVLGASESFGLYEPAGKEYPRQLQDSLAARGCLVDVLNAALPGFTIPTISVTYRNYVRGMGATVAVVYPTPVQYLDANRPAFTPPTSGPPARPLLSNFRVVRRLRDHLKAILPTRLKTYLRSREIAAMQKDRAGAQQWTAIPDDRMEAFRADLGALLDTLTASGVRPLVATHANAFAGRIAVDTALLVAWAKFYPDAAMGLLPRFESAANGEVLRIARERGLPVSDLAATMSTLGKDSVFADFSHFTAAGSATVAGQLARDILAATGCPAAAH